MLKKRQSEELMGAQGKDFSGLDFIDLVLQGQNFFESIFNGCSFEAVRASQSIFQHAEFTETFFSNCIFEDTSFDHSDFVMSNIKNTEFIRCSFQNAEWRDTTFDNVKFRQCIFRNTTTSLTLFTHCNFDESSSASFVGRSKRFSLFSESVFHLPPQYVEFLYNNFGINSSEQISISSLETQDPLFQLSILRYNNQLTSEKLYQIITEFLAVIISDDSLNLLKLRYMIAICKVCIYENLLSVFALQLFENKFSQIAENLPYREQLLEFINLILTIRIAIHERIAVVEEKILEFSNLMPSKMQIQLEFENTYSRQTIKKFVNQMSSYNKIPQNEIVITSIRTGSTLVDLLITASVFVPDIIRFIQYSLSLASVSFEQLEKIQKGYKSLTAESEKVTKPKKSSSKLTKQPKKIRKELPGETVVKAIKGIKSEDTESVEVMVDIAKDQILVVDGRVKVRISLI